MNTSKVINKFIQWQVVIKTPVCTRLSEKLCRANKGRF